MKLTLVGMRATSGATVRVFLTESIRNQTTGRRDVQGFEVHVDLHRDVTDESEAQDLEIRAKVVADRIAEEFR